MEHDESEDIQSAYVGGNAEIFEKVCRLHLNRGDSVADITYGKGTFWNDIPESYVNLTASDKDPNKSPLGKSVDCRDLPFESNRFDAVVFDPPYSSGFYKEVNQKASSDSEYSAFRDSYTSESTDWSDELHPSARAARKRHARVLDIYYRGIDEAQRVLQDDGKLICKVQDEVSDNLNYMTHVELINYCESIGFTTRDLFVCVRPNRATTPNDNQHAALKRHSYFLIFDMSGGSLRQ